MEPLSWRAGSHLLISNDPYTIIKSSWFNIWCGMLHRLQGSNQWVPNHQNRRIIWTPPKLSCQSPVSRWPHKGATKISPSQTCCILSVTFSFLLLMGSVCIPLAEWLLLTLSAHFDFNCHPSISNVIFSFSHLISCAHLKSAPSPHPSVFVMGRCAGAHLNWSHFSLTRG